MILFIYYNSFLATKWLCCTSRDWVVGRSFSGWWLITLLSCSIPRRAAQPDKTSVSSQKTWTDNKMCFHDTQFQSSCKFSCHFRIPFFSTFLSPHLPFFKVVSKVRFFCNLAGHFSSKLLNWAPFRKEWHTKIIFASAIICLVGYLYFYWCICGESFQRMVYFLHICMIDNGLFWYL